MAHATEYLRAAWRSDVAGCAFARDSEEDYQEEKCIGGLSEAARTHVSIFRDVSVCDRNNGQENNCARCCVRDSKYFANSFGCLGSSLL